MENPNNPQTSNNLYQDFINRTGLEPKAITIRTYNSYGKYLIPRLNEYVSTITETIQEIDTREGIIWAQEITFTPKEACFLELALHHTVYNALEYLYELFNNNETLEEGDIPDFISYIVQVYQFITLVKRTGLLTTQISHYKKRLNSFYRVLKMMTKVPLDSNPISDSTLCQDYLNDERLNYIAFQ